MSAGTGTPVVLAVGRAVDGVTAYALECAESAGATSVHVDELPETATAAVARALQGADSGTPLHLHVTDRLFTGEGRAGAEDLLAAVGDRPLVVTLHDVPQPAEGPERARRRAGFYRELGRRAGRVVVSSDHEHRLCGDLGIDVDAVIPLPLPDLATGEAAAPGRSGGVPSVGVFGYLHPGKAVDVVVDELCRLTEPPALHLLGEPSAGSEDYVADLVDRARSSGVDVRLTGRIPHGRLASVLAAVTVPLCLFRNVSASGSLATWIAAGRRPLVFDGEYTREIEDRWPGSLVVTAQDRVGSTLVELLADPALTRRTAPLPQWGRSEVADAHRRLWASLDSSGSAG